MRRVSIPFVALLGLCSNAALAADPVDYTSADRELSFVGGVGYVWLKADEVVYGPEGDRLSHLFWKTHAPVLTGSVRAEFAPRWKIMGNAVVALSASGDMKDYDWFGPYFKSYDFDDWTHRSASETSLDRYVNVDVAVGRDFDLSDAAQINLHAGFKYANVKWTAYGGSFVYSRTGFRQDIGSYPDGLRGISYEQRLPTLFAGAEASAKAGRLTFTGLVRGGITVGVTDTDHHWRRGLRFEEPFDAVPFLSLGGKVDYAVSEAMSLQISAGYERYFPSKGDPTVYSISSGAELLPARKDEAGLAFQAFTLSAGLKLSF